MTKSSTFTGSSSWIAQKLARRKQGLMGRKGRSTSTTSTRSSGRKSPNSPTRIQGWNDGPRKYVHISPRTSLALRSSSLTRPQFDIFAKDIVLIPINHNNAHWTAAAINFRRQRIESYDSMGMSRRAVFEVRSSRFCFCWPSSTSFSDCGIGSTKNIRIRRAGHLTSQVGRTIYSR